MLGAGVDPLNKDQDFSILAKTGKNLMGAHFLKPGASKTRFPPVINVFSRTLASPICSSPFPLPLPHRIASNLSEQCIGLYIHEEKKMLLFENTFLHSFEAGSEFGESLATEKEEVTYGSLLLYDEQEAIKRGEQASKLNYREKKELESKILRKKLVFERYIGYLTG